MQSCSDSRSVHSPTNRRVPAVAIAAGFLCAPSLLAQGRSCAAPERLATLAPFQSTHYQSAPGQNNTSNPPVPQLLPAGYHGHGTYANLTANAQLAVSQIDFRLNDDGFLRYNWSVSPGTSGGPGMVGQTTTVDVYMTPGSWQGLWNGGPLQKAQVAPGAGSPWALVGSGTLTVRPYHEHSPAVFSTPFTVPVGTNGFAFLIRPIATPVAHITYATPPYALHPSLLVRSFAPGAPLTASDQFLTISDEDVTSQAFVNMPGPAAKNAVFELHYDVAGSAAYYARTGNGCYDRPRSFYEYFLPGQFDLANSSIEMVPHADGYTVGAGTAQVVPPVSSPLTTAGNAPLGDDARTGVKQLGFPFPYPGGSTTSIVVTCNGNIFLDPARSGDQLSAFDSFGVHGFLHGQPQLTAWWCDHNPAAGGSIHLDTDLSGAVPVAYVTWNNVPEWNNPGTGNTFQVAMFGDGRVEFRYGNCTPANLYCLAGFSAGWSDHDPGSRDLSAGRRFSTGNGALPPELGMSARPIFGSTSDFVLRDLPTNTTGVVLVGLPVYGFDLRFVGMPDCVQRVLPMAWMPFQAVGDTASVPFTIPNCRWLHGRDLGAQSLVVSPGSNPANRTISNPICLHIGQ